MASQTRRLLVAGAVIAALLGGGALGFVFPTHLVGVVGWSAVVVAVLYGFGSAVADGWSIDLALGERLVIGTLVWLTAGGILLAFGLASRVPLLVLAAIGFALAAVAFVRRARGPATPLERDDTTFARVVFWIALSLFLFANLLGMAGTRANPFDDQVSYTAFVKRLLEVGNLTEPFSFRRLSAYGGQTLLQALAALRGDVDAIDLLDRGIFQWIAMIVTLDFARRRRLHLGLVVALILFILCLWDMALNSAAIWTGYTLFLSAYSFASREDLAPRRALLLTFATAAGACVLRQNYLVPAGLFAALVLVFHVRALAKQSSWREAIHAERRTIGLAVGVTALVLLPYMVEAWRACGTFLYPILQGTANPATPLRPTGGTFVDELLFFVNVVFNSEPIRIWWLLVPLMLIAKDTRGRRPWSALLIASVVGFVMLVHSFTLSDSYNLWRYSFGSLTPLVIIFAIEAGAQKPFAETESPLRMSKVSTFLVWLAVLVQLVIAKDWPAKRFAWNVANIRAAIVLGTGKYDPRFEALRAMQDSIPADTKVALMIDDPYRLDFARNQLVCLDLPGFAAPAPGLPSFTTPENWRAYFRSQGIRYLAFAETGYSTWLYRREGWLWRMYSDDELFRYIGAHVVDTLDTFEELARSSKVLFHKEGFYAIDLGDGPAVEPDRGPPEIDRMYRYIREVSESQLHTNAWQLASRGDVVFKPDGQGPSDIVPLPHVADEPDHHSLMALIFGNDDPPPFRWMTDRTLVRVRGQGGHHLHIKTWIKQNRLYAKPIVSVSLDGVPLAKAFPDADGNVVFDLPVQCTGWCNVYLTLSTMSEWWLSADGLRAAKLLEFDWTRAQ
jgi:hypothetical protein